MSCHSISSANKLTRLICSYALNLRCDHRVCVCVCVGVYTQPYAILEAADPFSVKSYMNRQQIYGVVSLVAQRLETTAK